jgi:hypothetical protein
MVHQQACEVALHALCRATCGNAEQGSSSAWPSGTAQGWGAMLAGCKAAVPSGAQRHAFSTTLPASGTWHWPMARCLQCNALLEWSSEAYRWYILQQPRNHWTEEKA